MWLQSENDALVRFREGLLCLEAYGTSVPLQRPIFARHVPALSRCMPTGVFHSQEKRPVH